MSVVGSRRWRLAAAVAAVVVGAALLTPTVASASGSERKDVTLSFAQAPSGWSVVEGQAADVGTLAVNGIAGVNKKHIQWAIKGSAAFSVVGDKDTATVRYDGTTLDADKVRLRITADIGSYRARKLNWNVTRAGVIVRVAVTASAEPAEVPSDPGAGSLQQTPGSTGTSERPVARDPKTFTEAERRGCVAFFSRGGAGDSANVPEHCRNLDITDVEVGWDCDENGQNCELRKTRHTHLCTHPTTTFVRYFTIKGPHVELKSTPYDGKKFTYAHSHVVYPRRNADSPAHTDDGHTAFEGYEGECLQSDEMIGPSGNVTDHGKDNDSARYRWRNENYAHTARAKYIMRWVYQIECNKAGPPAFCGPWRDEINS
ncbi:hypothetical protein [Candidatus Poriferisodalis sp.]|uniref:hypothetical protein n=1 Tax=Candidatus Poriferisodalis sp. TaxID=3101277 RepID=UPI003B01D8A1